MLFPENLHRDQTHELHLKPHPRHLLVAHLHTKFELRPVQSLLHISLQGRSMGQNWVPEPKMLSLNRNEHELHNKSGKLSYKPLEQRRQPD